MRAPLLIIILAASLITGGVWMEYRNFLSQPLPSDREDLTLDVKPGTSLRGLSRELVELGILQHPYLFMLMAYLEDKATGIKAGEYELPPEVTAPELLDLITSGKVIQRPFTIVEGWTYRRLLAEMAGDDRFRQVLGGDPTAEDIMTRLGRPEAHPEGRFLPETYHFSKGARDLDILRRAYEAMERAIAEEWEKRMPGLPLEGPYEALIMASIVEKETGLAAERPLIAGVFLRRLDLGMKLQTDPTVIYGLGDRFDGNLIRAHLREDTPYNTYVHQGLPPTPIALPGRAAIHGVLHPQESEALYFVAKGDGSHYFSATLAEHNQAVRRYQIQGRKSN